MGTHTRCEFFLADTMRIMHIARRALQAGAALVGISICAIGILLGLMWLDHRTATILPVPTGPSAVGRTGFAWVDATQMDKLAPRPGIPRELIIWIWYPALRTSAAPVDYLPRPWRKAVESYRGALITDFLDRDPSGVKTHSTADPELSPQQPKYPVVIMRAGASALTLEYSVLAEDLASHGYVVVGFDAPYRTQVVVFPDGRVIIRAPENDPDRFDGAELERVSNRLLDAWTADTVSVLNWLTTVNASASVGRFTGRLDLDHVGVFGHSLGGATALQFCHDDARCEAGVDLDGLALGNVVREGLHQPFMFLMSDHSSETNDSATGRIEADLKAIYDRLPPEGRLRAVIQGASHYGFSDGAVLRSLLAQRAARSLGALGVDGRRQLGITTYYLRSFLDMELKGLPQPDLDRPLPRYPEVHFSDWPLKSRLETNR